MLHQQQLSVPISILDKPRGELIDELAFVIERKDPSFIQFIHESNLKKKEGAAGC